MIYNNVSSCINPLYIYKWNIKEYAYLLNLQSNQQNPGPELFETDSGLVKINFRMDPQFQLASNNSVIKSEITCFQMTWQEISGRVLSKKAWLLWTTYM